MFYLNGETVSMTVSDGFLIFFFFVFFRNWNSLTFSLTWEQNLQFL